MAAQNILSLDGGGSKGIVSAVLVTRLHEETNFLDHVDLFAGTSIGAANAAALAIGHPPKKMVDFYLNQGCSLFDQHFKPAGVPGYLLKLLSHIPFIDKWAYKSANLFWPKWDNAGLKTALAGFFSSQEKLGDVQKQLLITATELEGQLPYSSDSVVLPVSMTNFLDDQYKDLSVSEVVLRSMSAPVYFESHSGFVDGGMYADNPSIAALAAATNSDPARLSGISMLSIGTGISTSAIQAPKPLRWGLLQWGTRAFSTSEVAVCEFDALQTRALMGENYFRLNITLPRAFALDDCSELEELKSLAEEAAESEAFKSAVEFINTKLKSGETSTP